MGMAKVKRIEGVSSEAFEYLMQMMDIGITATNSKDVYSCGVRNGIRWCKSLLEDDPPKFEDVSVKGEKEQ